MASDTVTLTVRFYEQTEDALLKFAVILAKSDKKWVFCKHKARDTYEIPGGHREEGERIDDTAKRELYEETGALQFQLTPVCIYSVTAKDNFDGTETFGKLYYAEIQTFEKELHSEIEKNHFNKRTYPKLDVSANPAYAFGRSTAARYLLISKDCIKERIYETYKKVFILRLRIPFVSIPLRLWCKGTGQRTHL